MNKLTLDDFLKLVNEYNGEELERVKKAYFFADKYHSGVKRESGDPYITHPLNVAYTLGNMHADGDTLCAGLLHDTIEDTVVTKEQIAHEFNPSVANLVDGVTNIQRINFSPEEKYFANNRKVVEGLTKDARIDLIKIADVLHNVSTLEFKRREKQIEKAKLTLEIYAPISYYLGAYNIKNELEDRAFMFLEPDIYRKISLQRQQIEADNIKMLERMEDIIYDALMKNNIKCEIRFRVKNIYGIYKKLQKACTLADIHDLFAIKIVVNDELECYRALGIIHKLFTPINERFKDYICDPKTNMYSSLHTTVFVPDNRLVQIQIRTKEMDKLDSEGISAYWDMYKGEANYSMLKDLKEKYQFFKIIVQLGKMFPNDDKTFLEYVKREVFSDKIYVRASSGKRIELPEGSTVIDFAYMYDMDGANTMIGAYVNDKFVLPTEVLHNKDRIKLIRNDYAFGPKTDWEEAAQSSYVRQLIRENKTEF